MAALVPLTPALVPSPAQPSTSSAAAPAAPSPRLVKAAHEFEAQMMEELLAPMTGADSDVDSLSGDGDDSGDTGLALGSGSGSGGALSAFASEALGQALSERGGFGIADRIIHQLGPASRRLENESGSTKNAKRKASP
jgi:Rod binding domain-containing protein